MLKMETVLSLRQKLVHDHYHTKDIDKLKHVMFLDLCLESYTRQITESVMHQNYELPYYVMEISVLLDNLILSYGSDWKELSCCKEDF